MAKTMKVFTLCSFVGFMLSFGKNLSLCISLGTVFYHLAMRLAVGHIYDYAMQNRANLSSKHWQLRPWEKSLYEKLGVKKWKGNMPTYDPELFSPQKHSWEEIAQAMCQAELVHSTIIPLSFLPLLAAIPWGSFGVFLITSLLAACYDAIFVIMQRYNRPRIMRLLKKENQRL